MVKTYMIDLRAAVMCAAAYTLAPAQNVYVLCQQVAV